MSRRIGFTGARGCRAGDWPASLDAEQFDFEDERRVGRNLAAALRAIAEVGGDDELALAADMHAQDAFVPAGDDRAGADLKRVRLAAINRAFELRAVFEPTGVMHGDAFAEPRLVAGADDFVNILDAGSGGDFSAALLAAAGERQGAGDDQCDDVRAAAS